MTLRRPLAENRRGVFAADLLPQKRLFLLWLVRQDNCSQLSHKSAMSDHSGTHRPPKGHLTKNAGCGMISAVGAVV
jgi:hypothetical protein